MKPILSQIEKEYSPRGPLHQFRFKEAIAFHCFRCGTSKKAKLLTCKSSRNHEGNKGRSGRSIRRLARIAFSGGRP